MLSRTRQLRRRPLAALLALLALAMLALSSACAATTPSAPPLPQRNAPASGPMLVDHSLEYYRDLSRALQYADDPVVRASIQRLQNLTTANWLADSARDAEGKNPDIGMAIQHTEDAIADTLDQPTADQTVPLFVLYNLPVRDLGGESAGGLGSADDYRLWIKSVSRSIGQASAVAVLEPDGLAASLNMNGPQGERQRQERLGLLRESLLTFRANNPHLAVYLDIGHSKWPTMSQTIDLLRTVDPEGTLITSVSLNVSNQRPDPELVDYAARLQAAYGHQLYVLLDSSMNGAPLTPELDQEWCNAVGEKLGDPGDNFFDAAAPIERAIIKRPGQSDGRCNTSDRPAGEFDGALLLRQLEPAA